MFILLSITNSSPSGILSFISSANAFTLPSLYTLIVYTTISPVFTNTGVFLWVYIAVVVSSESSSNGPTSTSGTLSVTSVSFTCVINFLKAKSYIG